MTPKILVVDDDTNLVQVVKMSLELAEGYEVATAMDGLQALASVRENPPDIIIMDVMMPNLDGIEACRQLKADPETSHIPVILCTALTADNDIARGMAAGADIFVHKPFHLFSLTETVKEFLNKKTAPA